jgi:hypothetical protein
MHSLKCSLDDFIYPQIVVVQDYDKYRSQEVLEGLFGNLNFRTHIFEEYFPQSGYTRRSAAMAYHGPKLPNTIEELSISFIVNTSVATLGGEYDLANNASLNTSCNILPVRSFFEGVNSQSSSLQYDGPISPTVVTLCLLHLQFKQILKSAIMTTTHGISTQQVTFF